jgi:hypothetical protein
MEPTTKRFPSLAEIEREVIAEGREWTRQRLQARLQQLADQQSEVSPPPPTPKPKLHAVQRGGRDKTDR